MSQVKRLNAEQQKFCDRLELSEAQFFGEEIIERDLILTDEPGIPEGFSPSIIHACLDLQGHTKIPSSLRPKVITCYLDIRDLDEIPEGFAPFAKAVFYGKAGYGDVKVATNFIDVSSPESPSRERASRDLQIVEGYVAADGYIHELIEKNGRVYTLLNVETKRVIYLYSDGKVSAHGATPEKAKADYRFKKIALKYEHQKIKADDIITPELYRALTGACQLGVDEWMECNIPAKDLARVKTEGVTARQLRDMLRLNGGYGGERFEKLCEF